MFVWLKRVLGYNNQKPTSLGNLRPTSGLTLDRKPIAKQKLQEVKRRVPRQTVAGDTFD